MKSLYKQIVNDLSIILKRKPVYVAHCILGRYKAKRSEIPVFVNVFRHYGIQVTERDFLQGTRISNNKILKLFRSMRTKPKHDKPVKYIAETDNVYPVDKILSVDI